MDLIEQHIKLSNELSHVNYALEQFGLKQINITKEVMQELGVDCCSAPHEYQAYFYFDYVSVEVSDDRTVSVDLMNNGRGGDRDECNGNLTVHQLILDGKDAEFKEVMIDKFKTIAENNKANKIAQKKQTLARLQAELDKAANELTQIQENEMK